MVVIAICLGLRVSEILGLQWGDISWKKCEVHIRRAVVLGTVGQVKTPGSESRMPLDPDLATLLLEYRRMAPSVSPRTGCFKIRDGGNPGGRRTFNRNGSVPPASRRPARTESMAQLQAHVLEHASRIGNGCQSPTGVGATFRCRHDPANLHPSSPRAKAGSCHQARQDGPHCQALVKGGLVMGAIGRW
jgi:integrase